jgi:RsiW-degrading membrane proteinase PrsW (M82 family)
VIEVFASSVQYPKEFFFCFLLALIPTIVWFLIFGQNHRNRWMFVFLTFFAGVSAAALILSYQFFWGGNFDFIFFSVSPQNFQEGIQSQVKSTLLSSLLLFLSIGFLEEYAKHWLVKMTDHNIFESIDDVIEFSIIGALGFAFLENIGYFFLLILNGEGENLISLFFIRSIFVVFVHILCSGIYGYFYGLGYFAKPILEKREREGKMPKIPQWIHRTIHLRKVQVFRDEMATLGLLISMTLHGIYDFLLEVKTLGGLLEIFFGIPQNFVGANIQLHIFVLPCILFFGFLYLSYLLRKKEDQKRWGRLEVREVFRIPSGQRIIQ